MDFKKIKKTELVKMIENLKIQETDQEQHIDDLEDIIFKNNEYKQKYLQLQDENNKLVIELNNIKNNMDRKIDNLINSENNNTIDYLKKRISQTQNEKKQKYINDLKKYLN
jgi:hypothetical protein